MEVKIVKINEVEIYNKEFNKEKVVTAWDIAKVHNREPREITQQFNRNKDKFILNEDYFKISSKEFSERFKTIQSSESQSVIQNFIPNNVKEIVLFTESGYLMLVKTFTDDLSWDIQRKLVKGYFKLKEIASMTNKEQYLLNILRADGDLEKTLAIKEFDDKYIKPLEIDLKNTTDKLEHKQEVINGISNELKIKTQRQFLNEIIKMKGVELIQDRWNLLYKQYELHKHINLKVRIESYNIVNTPKIKSKLQFIDEELKDISTLYNIAVKLFESDFKDKLKKYIEVL